MGWRCGTSGWKRARSSRYERYLENPDQLRLDFGDTPEAASAAEGLAEALEQATSALAEIVVPEHIRRPHAPRKTRNEQLPAVLDDDPKSKCIAEVFAAARAEKKPSVTARMWVYRSVAVLLNVFDFTVSRHRDGPDQFLIDSQFTGTLLADCYSGYQGITLRSDARIARAACNAHARRKLFDARENQRLGDFALSALLTQEFS